MPQELLQPEALPPRAPRFLFMLRQRVFLFGLKKNACWWVVGMGIEALSALLEAAERRGAGLLQELLFRGALVGNVGLPKLAKGQVM